MTFNQVLIASIVGAVVGAVVTHFLGVKGW